jgi:hypothetical protein
MNRKSDIKKKKYILEEKDPYSTNQKSTKVCSYAPNGRLIARRRSRERSKHTLREKDENSTLINRRVVFELAV